MPASPELLPKPLPKMTAQLPLCRRRICGVPNVLAQLLPQLVTLAQLIVPLFHSPMTMLEALPSVKLLPGFVMSSAIDGGAADTEAADEPGVPLAAEEQVARARRRVHEEIVAVLRVRIIEHGLDAFWIRADGRRHTVDALHEGLGVRIVGAAADGGRQRCARQRRSRHVGQHFLAVIRGRAVGDEIAVDVVASGAKCRAESRRSTRRTPR